LTRDSITERARSPGLERLDLVRISQSTGSTSKAWFALVPLHEHGRSPSVSLLSLAAHDVEQQAGASVGDGRGSERCRRPCRSNGADVADECPFGSRRGQARRPGEGRSATALTSSATTIEPKITAVPWPSRQARSPA